jgi:hypothetical protein
VPRVRPTLAIGIASAVAIAALLVRAEALHEQVRQPLSLAGSSYTGSGACRACHPGNYASWHRTFHRTMTQEATAASVLGDFEHGTLDYLGVSARMRRDERGRFVIDWSRRGGRERWSAVVERTVGSRRYQQYLARDGDVYFRLPVAWNIEEQRFMHMNGAFLTADPARDAPDAPVARADYDRHVTRWNDNCVYCHNVAPNPGLDRERGRFETQVAELGVACEACHGPAARHVAQNRDPLRRFMLHLGGAADPSIANPARLDDARSAEVCGHCHGQRLAPDIEAVHAHGDRFVPGEELTRYSRPLARDTALGGDAHAFEARFWPDGTARLTAYEYQGLLQSACARRGSMTCISCHGMHSGDPRGQIRPERAGDAACTACHTELAEAKAAAAHSHHDASGAGARCVSCHMPRVVYGLVRAQRSHRVDSPRPELAAGESRPDACTLCHVDRTRAWAADAMRAWKAGAPGCGEVASAGDEIGGDVARMLFAGDPIERALAADALGRAEAHGDPARAPSRAGMLFDVMLADDYPAVRSIAWRSLRALIALRLPDATPPVGAFTPTDARAQRAAQIAAIASRLPDDFAVAPGASVLALRAQAPAVQIAIGE